MIADYDDDTHFCLKCHATIIGLDNYVNHRKGGCITKNDVPKSPLPSQLLPPDDSFNLKADDFFSSLELQSSSKKPTPSTSGKNLGILTRSKTTAIVNNRDDATHSKSGKNAWIGGDQLKLGYGDNQSKLIKAVDNLERRNKEEPSRIEVSEESEVELEEYEYDESSSDDDHDAPPRNHTGGKWKPSSPIHDWSVPSPSYTGGKWKPKHPPPSHTKGKWLPTYTSSPNYDAPPPNFTGGKWKTKTEDETEHHLESEPSTSKGKSKVKSHILPTYTKGKWLPQSDGKKIKLNEDSPFRKSSGTVQYWCRACNRRLASKIVYERHLKSELHFKRTSHENEFDDINLIKRIKKKTNFLSNTKVIKYDRKINKRQRKRIYLRCEVCNSKVNTSLIGKHLISHYHCRKGDITSDAAKKIVLDNIEDIILQSPFQCGICRFYFNFHKDFLTHWTSDQHDRKQSGKSGYFWCSLCKFRTYTNSSMLDHLMSKEHDEVVSVINRSVPIIIKKINPVQCNDCSQEFLLNVQLIRHCREENHAIPANNDNYCCTDCNQIFKSNISLKWHRQNVHRENVFICTICEQTFGSSQEAKKHRKSSSHRHKFFAEKNQKIMKTVCDYCKQHFEQFTELKDHIIKNHQEQCPKCPYCGMRFPISQDLTVHLRTKSCQPERKPELKNTCSKCLFSTDSTSEYLFHQALHTEPLTIYPDDKKTKKPIISYKCPICEKLFPKASLEAHLRLHTKERPFVCEICGKSFVRKNNWQYHLKNHEKRIPKIKKEISDRPFLCSICGASFRKRFILQQHMTIHSGKLFKCPESDCMVSARTMAELKIHFRTHSNTREFACKLCDYKGKTKQQLIRHTTIHDSTKKYQCDKCQFSARTSSQFKRHTRLHTGSKPYQCPHCSYRCNNLENLRKHIISTNKHPGRTVYECKFCDQSPYKTNFAKDFRVHLLTKHRETFGDSTEAACYVAGIYDAKSDKTAAESTTTGEEESYSMFVISKEDDEPETWNLVASYDVEESGTLIPFNTVLFHEDFQ